MFGPLDPGGEGTQLQHSFWVGHHLPAKFQSRQPNGHACRSPLALSPPVGHLGEVWDLIGTGSQGWYSPNGVHRKTHDNSWRARLKMGGQVRSNQVSDLTQVSGVLALTWKNKIELCIGSFCGRAPLLRLSWVSTESRRIVCKFWVLNDTSLTIRDLQNEPRN